MGGSETERLTRIEEAVGYVKTEMTDLKLVVDRMDGRIGKIERAAYIAAGVIVAAGGGGALVTQLLGGQ